MERWLSPVEGARLEIECTVLTTVPWVRIPLSPPVIYSLTLDMVEPVRGNMVDPCFLDSKRRTERMRGSLRLCSDRRETKERIPLSPPVIYSLTLDMLETNKGSLPTIGALTMFDKLKQA